MKPVIKILGLLSIALVLAMPAIGQSKTKKISHDENLWLHYYAKIQFPHDWGIDFEIEDRRYAFPDRQLNWLLPRVAVHHPLGAGWEANVGFMYYTTAQPGDASEAVTLTVPELRPHVEIDYKQKAGKLTLSHRYRMEERFTRKTTDNHLASGYNFNFRMRYRLQVQYPLVKPKNGHALDLKVNDELLVNFGHNIVRNGFDCNRLYGGLNYTFSPTFQLEAGYMKWFQEKSNGEDYISRDILRLTFYHNINLKH